MHDTELYRQILGLEKPWFVGKVDLNVTGQQVDVFVEHEPGVSWPCPECNRELACRDHAEERAWRHLDSCQFRTFLHARVPRVDCPEHGVLQVRVPWAEARSRFTLLMERFVIDVLQQCANLSAARRILRISWDEAWGVMDRAVARGRARKKARVIPYFGVDEKAFRKGYQFMTLVCDLERSTVEHIAEDRKIESLRAYWESLTPKQLAGIEAVAMDMWAPYIEATAQAVPEGRSKIVFDRFHIMQYMVEAVDMVRRREHHSLKSDGDESLKGTKYLWLYNRENVPPRQRSTLATLQALCLKVGRAWAIKESLRELWTYRRLGWARRFFRRWFWWATHSRLAPVCKVAHMLRNHLENILTYCRHAITNGVAEGLNSKIMTIKRRACGYRNKEHFKTAVYFFCGGLDLYPR
jgi:transposase